MSCRLISSLGRSIGLTAEEVRMLLMSPGETNRLTALSRIRTDTSVHMTSLAPFRARMDAAAKYPQNISTAIPMRMYVTTFLSIFFFQQALYGCYEPVYVSCPEGHEDIRVPVSDLGEQVLFFHYFLIGQVDSVEYHFR